MKRTVSTPFGAVLLVCASAVSALNTSNAASITPSVTGDAVAAAIGTRVNFAAAANGGVAFSSSDLGPAYAYDRLNDGVFDNSGNSWIPATTGTAEFAGVRLQAPATIAAVVFGGQIGYNGRSAGTWSLQYTTDATVQPTSAWTEIGTYIYTEPGCASPMPRSMFAFPAVANVTGLRLVLQNSVCGGQLCVQEFEAYEPVVVPPEIVSQPVGGTVEQGGDFTFSVAANNAETLQWLKNGEIIAGATGASFTVSDAKTTDAGQYSVTVSNLTGGVISDTVSLEVTPAQVYPTYAETVLADAPIHYFPMDETEGTTANDAGSLAAVGGTYTGGVTLGQPSVIEKLGKAVRFDGSLGTMVDLGLFHPGPNISIEAWVNLDPSATSPWSAIVARWDGSYELDFAGSTANLVIRSDANPAALGLAAAAAPSTRGEWHHVVGVFSEGKLSIYVDGVKGSEQTLGGGLQNLGPNPDRVLIGATREGSMNFKGLIDEVAVYDFGLSAAQVRAHYRFLANNPIQVAPEIVSQPVGGAVKEGEDFTFTVAANNAEAFQWFKDNQPIAGATTATYSISDVRASHAGQYSVAVSNVAGIVTSDKVTLAVTPTPIYDTYSKAVLADAPIHYFPMDEAAGTTAADLGSLAGTGGIYTGGVTLGQPAVLDKLGKAVRFDGNNGTFVDLGQFHPGPNISIEAWVNQDPSTTSPFSAIVARWDGSYEMDFNGSTANLVIRNEGNGFGLVAGAAPSTRGQWHHVVSVFSEGKLSIYVDGVKGGEQTIGGALQNLGPTPDRVLIGATREGVYGFKGLIDEVAIYDVGLTPLQIRAHYHAAVPSEAPAVSIREAVILSWPSFPPGYTVEAAAKVEGPYQTLTITPMADGNKLWIALPMEPGKNFFRLVKP